MNDFTLAELELMLEKHQKPILDELHRVNTTLEKFEEIQKKTSDDIHDSVRETELVKLQLEFVKKSQEEFGKSLDENWKTTRDMSGKFKFASGVGAVLFVVYEVYMNMGPAVTVLAK